MTKLFYCELQKDNSTKEVVNQYKEMVALESECINQLDNGNSQQFILERKFSKEIQDRPLLACTSMFLLELNIGHTVPSVLAGLHPTVHIHVLSESTRLRSCYSKRIGGK